MKNPDEINDPPRPFMEHLYALRDCIVHSLAAWVVCACVAGYFSPWVLEWIKAPVTALEAAGRLHVEGLDITSGFSTILSIGVWGGVALAFPFLVFFILRFVFPALTKREKFMIVFYLTFGTATFAFGFALAYSRMLPAAVGFFDKVNEWVHLPVTIVRIDGYVSLVLKAILGLGLVFQIPLILFILGCLGIISSQTLRSFRKFAIVIAFFLGMVLTPPDPMSQFIMALPLVILYEACIWAVWLKEKASRS